MHVLLAPSPSHDHLYKLLLGIYLFYRSCGLTYTLEKLVMAPVWVPLTQWHTCEWRVLSQGAVASHGTWNVDKNCENSLLTRGPCKLILSVHKRGTGGTVANSKCILHYQVCPLVLHHNQDLLCFAEFDYICARDRATGQSKTGSLKAWAVTEVVACPTSQNSVFTCNKQSMSTDWRMADKMVR